MDINPAESLRTLSQGKPAAIFGTGVSGTSAAALLLEYGIESVFYEEKDSKNAGGNVGEFDETAAKKHSLAVYSPAFRPDHKWLKQAQSAGIETLCEPDLAAMAWKGKIIAITGTDGKTTLTKFAAHVLRKYGFDAVTAGNIGTPLSRHCADFKRLKRDSSESVAVCELSSFQSFGLRRLKFDALVWTNFDADHMDWHRSMKEYFNAKYNLVKLLSNKIFITDKTVALAAEKYADPLPSYAKIMDFDTPEFKTQALNSPEPFNSSIQSKNYAMACELCRAFAGISENQVRAAAADFELPQYRFGTFIKIGGIKFYNDSKSTNAHSASAALRELYGAPNLIWIGGGKDKFSDLTELCNEVRKCAVGAVLIGQTAKALSSMLSGLPLGAHVCENMEDAVKKAYEMCPERRGTVLFSPAFSSFGMFSGYVERGKSFEKNVLCLKNLKEC